MTTPTTAVAKVPADKLAPFREAMKKAQASFAQALPATVQRYLTPDRLTKITLSAISRAPLLLQCTPGSVLSAVMDAASLGLEPTGGAMGHAYLVPFRGKSGQYEAQLIVGYRGYIALARRSGEIAGVEAHVVYERDRFELEFGRDPKLVHVPSFAVDRGEIIAAYCVALLRDGAKQVEFMTRAEIDATASRSRARDNGPWRTDFAEMCRKTVVRRAAKYWPLSIEIARAMDLEDGAEHGDATTAEYAVFEDTATASAPEPEPAATKRLAAKIKRGAQEAAPAPEPPHDEETGEILDAPAIVPADAPPPRSETEAEWLAKQRVKREAAMPATDEMPAWDEGSKQ